MRARSPDDPVLLSDLVIRIARKEDQRQAPVAAEKQRSATHRCVFPDAGLRSDRMQQLLSGAIPYPDSIEDCDQVNEMAIQCCRRDASAVLCVLPKTKRNDLWELKLHAETNLRSPILIEMRVAQILRSFDDVGRTKNLCACPSSRNLDTLPPLPHRTIFFSTTGYQPAGIQPRSDTTVSR